MVLLLVVAFKGCSQTLANHTTPLPPPEVSRGHNVNHEAELPQCHQSMEPGICRAYIPRWYYEPAANHCKEFVYGGCGANLNNFETEPHCNAACPDDIQCPTNQNKTCRVSESTCVAEAFTCPLYPEAICRVVPCSCGVEFVDVFGEKLTCEDETTTTPTPTTTTTTTTTAKPGNDGKEAETKGTVYWYMVPIGCVVVAAAAALVLLVLRVRNKKRRETPQLNPTNVYGPINNRDSILQPSQLTPQLDLTNVYGSINNRDTILQPSE